MPMGDILQWHQQAPAESKVDSFHPWATEYLVPLRLWFLGRSQVAADPSPTCLPPLTPSAPSQVDSASPTVLGRWALKRDGEFSLLPKETGDESFIPRVQECPGAIHQEELAEPVLRA